MSKNVANSSAAKIVVKKEIFSPIIVMKWNMEKK
jgi:hypothetical protein